MMAGADQTFDLYISAAAEDADFARSIARAADRMGLRVAPGGSASAVQAADVVVVLWSAAAADDARVPLEAPLAAFRSSLLLARLDGTPVPADQRRFLLNVAGATDPAAQVDAIMRRIADMLDLPHPIMTFADLVATPRPEQSADDVPPAPRPLLPAATPERLPPPSNDEADTVRPTMFVIRPTSDAAGPAAGSVPVALGTMAAAAVGATVTLIMYATGVWTSLTRMSDFYLYFATLVVAPIVGTFGLIVLAWRVLPPRDGRKRLLRLLGVIVIVILGAILLGATGAMAFDWLRPWLGLPAKGWLNLDWAIGGLTFAASVSLAALLFLPAGLGALRIGSKVARDARPSRVGAVVATPLLLATIVLAFVGYRDARAASLDQEIIDELARVGWTVHPAVPGMVDELGNIEMAERIRQFEAANGLAVTGKASFALLERLHDTPDKRTWRVALDGTGDARSLQEVFSRRTLPATIIVAPGVYRGCVAINGEGEEAFTIRGAGSATVLVCDGASRNRAAAPATDPFAAASKMADEMDGGLTDAAWMPPMFALGEGDRLEKLVLRQVNAVATGDFVTMTCSIEAVLGTRCATPPLIDGVTVEQAGKGLAVSVAGAATIRSSRFEGGTGTGLSLTGGKALVIGNTFRGFSKEQAISVAGSAAPRIVDNRFEALGGSASGIWVYGESRPTIENNDFANIASSAIAIQGSAAPVVLNNRFSEIRNSAITAYGKSKPRVDRNMFRGLAQSAFEASEDVRGSFNGNLIRLANASNSYVIYVGDRSRVNLLGNRVDAPDRSCIGIRGQAGGEVAENILDRCGAIELGPRTAAKIGSNRLPAVAEPIVRLQN